MKRRSRNLCLLLLSAWFVSSAAMQSASATTVKQGAWGRDAAGNSVDAYTLSSGRAQVTIVTYGARIVSVRVPDQKGTMANVVLGRDTVQGYSDGIGGVMGATIGRYANRIKGGSFTLDGATFNLPKNNGPNTLHGGPDGFYRKLWKARKVHNGVAMTLVSPDGDMGFPGEVTLQVTFTLETHHGDARLTIAYRATTTKDTVLNLTNHTFFNLANSSDQPVLQDVAMIAADNYTPLDATGIPTGELQSVAGTPFDFRTAHPVGLLMPQRGYDMNLVLRAPGVDNLAAEVDDPNTGRTLRVYTTEPALQLFVPHFAPPPSASVPPAAGAKGAGTRFPALEAFCLETQHFPDSPNQPAFPATSVKPGQVFLSTTIYIFALHTN